MTYPNPGQPENQPHFPVPDQYGGPGPATTAYQPVDQVFQPSAHLPAGPEFPPAGPSATPGPAPAAPRKKTGLVVLSVLTVLFFATAGVFGVLYSDATGENSRISAQLADKEKELTDSGKKLKDAQDEASKAKDAAQVAETGRKRAEDDGAAMVKCRDAARGLRDAIFAQDKARIEKALLDIVGIC
ncbi:hypothetical protein AB0I60_29420 [Actinosynnema sp. NPDC050436]|uniref:hypothetical protein n=1 Tax=Actinosynnema sp. NPDC050436 TaxID=3155659 RepID=UPI0034100097